MQRLNINLIIYLKCLVTHGSTFLRFLDWLIIIVLMSVNFHIGNYLKAIRIITNKCKEVLTIILIEIVLNRLFKFDSCFAIDWK